MTTIAFDGKTLAVDSQVNSGWMIAGSIDKILWLENRKAWFAASGSVGEIHAVAKWLDYGGDKPETDQMHGLIVHDDGRAYEIDDNLTPFPACIPWVGGSGEKFALAAMYLGCDAEKAVSVAIALDSGSGGEIKKVVIRADV